MRPRTPLKRLLTHPATTWGPGLWSCSLLAERGRDCGDCRAAYNASRNLLGSGQCEAKRF